jgi:hypothetical protein
VVRRPGDLVHFNAHVRVIFQLLRWGSSEVMQKHFNFQSYYFKTCTSKTLQKRLSHAASALDLCFSHVESIEDRPGSRWIAGAPHALESDERYD